MRFANMLSLLLLLSSFAFISSRSVSIGLSAQTQAELDLEKGLAAYWPFDEGAGDIAFDQSKYYNDLGLLCAGEGCSPPRWVEGKIGFGIELDGADDYLAVGDSDGLTGVRELTIAAWIKGDNFNQYATIIAMSIPYANKPGSFLGFFLGLFQGGGDNSLGQFSLGVSQGEGSGDNIQSITHLDLGKWYHIAGVFKGGEYLKIYVNGTVDNSKSTTVAIIALPPTEDPNPILVGQYAGFFSGVIDDVRIYERVLSDDEIMYLYEL